MKLKNKLIFICILALLICALLVPCAFAEEGEEAVVVEAEGTGDSEQVTVEEVVPAVEEIPVVEEIPAVEEVPVDETVVIPAEKEAVPEVPEEISNPELQGDCNEVSYSAMFYGLNDTVATLKGGEEMELSELVGSLCYEGEIESAVSSNPEALEIADGKVRILNPFGDEMITLVIGGQEVTIRVHDPEPITDIVAQFEAGGDFYLDRDIEIENGVLIVPSGKSVILDLNGYTLTGGKDESAGSVITVNGGTFTLNDSVGTGKVTGGSFDNGGGIFVFNGSFTMNGGSIVGNTATDFGGGGVFVIGTFIMNGGSITGNTAANGYGGGGVCVHNYSSFTMNGGDISGNTATNGGGVLNYCGKFIMENGSVSSNTAELGGGVVNFDGEFTMGNGSITGNTSDYGGGGVVNQSGTFIMENGSITGNTSDYGGGVLVLYNSSFTMNGGSISNNTANDDGGGIDNYADFLMTGGVITGNTANGTGPDHGLGGGVENVGKFKMTGGSITDNSSTTSGGGVYNQDTMTLGDDAQIHGNTAGTEGSKTANNLCLLTDKTVSVNDGFDGSIGVTTATVPVSGTPVDITGENDADYSEFFTSDNASFIVINGDDNVLQLIPAPAPEDAAEAVSVYVDGELLTEGVDYNWADGRIVFTAEFLATLEAGEHTLTIAFPGFTVEESFSFTDGAIVPAEDAKYLAV